MIDPSVTLQLKCAESLVTVCPGIGGTIARFTWRDCDILRPASYTAIADGLVRQMGCYPLVPYSNRIGNAKLIVGAQTWQLRANAPPEPHALHGFGWQRTWRVTSLTIDTAELMLNHEPDTDWPFACEATQQIQLTENTLRMTMAVRNTDHRPMPAGLGFHPYFPIDDDTKLQTAWKNMWAMDADSLPTELVAIPADADFTQPRIVDGWKIDNCFTGWSRCAVLDYPTHRVQLDASTACRQLVCFAPNDGRHFIALEPVTNINNAFALSASGVADTGVVTLAPGDALEIAISILIIER